MTPEEKAQLPERARLKESDIAITYLPVPSIEREPGRAKVVAMLHVPSNTALRWHPPVSRVQARLDLERAVAARGWQDHREPGTRGLVLP